MYIDVNLGMSLIVLLFVVMLLCGIIAAVGWVRYINELTEKTLFKEENGRLKYKLKVLEKKQIVAEAKAYGEETCDGV